MEQHFTYKEEIILIVIEKGLVVIVLAIITFYLSTLLEKFKTKSAFQQVFFELQIKSYNEILSCLQIHSGLKRNLINVLIEINVQLQTSQSLIDFENTDEYKKHTGTSFSDEFEKMTRKFNISKVEFANNIDSLNLLVSNNLLYLSDDFISGLAKYSTTLSNYKDQLIISNSIISKESAQLIIDALSNRETITKFALLQDIIFKEINKKIQ